MAALALVPRGSAPRPTPCRRTLGGLSRIELIEEVETLREAVRQYEALLRPAFEPPTMWRLSPREADILRALYAAHGRVLSEDAILTWIFGVLADNVPDSRVVPVFLSKLRAKLRLHNIKISTAWGRGWYLDAPALEQVRQAAVPMRTEVR